MYLTQLPDFNDEDPNYKINELLVKLVPDKETLTNDKEMGKSTKAHKA